MMKKNNKKCIVCQTEYTFCPSCSDFDHLPRWMNVYHDENCRNIFNAVSGYTHKRYTKEDAKELLKKCDLSNKHSFKENLNVLIDEILKEEYMKSIVVNDNVVEEVKEIAIHDVEEKPVYNKKKHYRNTKVEKTESVEE